LNRPPELQVLAFSLFSVKLFRGQSWPSMSPPTVTTARTCSFFPVSSALILFCFVVGSGLVTLPPVLEGRFIFPLAPPLVIPGFRVVPWAFLAVMYSGLWPFFCWPVFFLRVRSIFPCALFYFRSSLVAELRFAVFFLETPFSHPFLLL